MVDKDLRKLNRAELLEMLIVQSEQVETLQKRIEELESQLESRKIALNRAGSIAEASLQINGVFEAAQAAADLYLENVKNSEDNCDRLIEETQQKSEKMIAEAQARAEEILMNAKNEAESYWSTISSRLESFYSEHKGLQALLNFTDEK